MSSATPGPSSSDGESEEREYEVGRIVATKVENKQRFFKIKWKGYGPKYNTWEPEASIRVNCSDMVDNFLRKSKKIVKKLKLTAGMSSETPGPSSSDGESEEREYEVGRIVATKVENKQRFFKIKWKGYGPKYNTWEPEASIRVNCSDMVDDFLRRCKQKKSNLRKRGRITKTSAPKRKKTAQRTGSSFASASTEQAALETGQPSSSNNSQDVPDNGTAGQENHANGSAGQENHANGSAGQENHANGSAGQENHANGSARQEIQANESAGQENHANGSARQEIHANGSARQEIQANGSAGQENHANGSAGQENHANGSAGQENHANGSAGQENHANGSAGQETQANGSVGQEIQGAESAESQPQHTEQEGLPEAVRVDNINIVYNDVAVRNMGTLQFESAYRDRNGTLVFSGRRPEIPTRLIYTVNEAIDADSTALVRYLADKITFDNTGVPSVVLSDQSS